MARLGRKLRLTAGVLGVVSMMAVPGASMATQEGFLGEIKFFGGNFNPRGWALCDGQFLAISSATALFSILGTTYGGDGRTTFALPDMRGRSPVHQGNGPGLPSVSLGQKGGAASFALTIAQMPSHDHGATTTSTLNAYSGAGDKNSPGGNVLSNDGSDRIYSEEAPDVQMDAAAITSTTTVANQGSSQSVSHRSPFIAVNCIICIDGTFPSR